MQKTMSGIMQVIVEKVEGDSVWIRVNLINRKGVVLWTLYQNQKIGDSLNLMGATFKLSYTEAD